MAAGAIVSGVLGGAGLLSGLLGPKPQKQATVQDTHSDVTTQNQGTGSSLPLYDPTQLAARDDIFRRLLGRLNTDPSMSGYSAEGLQNINNTSDARQQVLQGILSSRGINGPQAAYATGNQESNRLGQQTQFLNQIPLLRDELQRRNLTDYTNFFRSLPVGNSFNTNQVNATQTNQHTEGNGSIVTPGGIGQGVNNLADILAGLYGSGAFAKKPGGGSSSTQVPGTTVGPDYGN